MKQPITIFGGYDPMKEVNELVVKAKELRETPQQRANRQIFDNGFCKCGNKKMNNSDFCSECI